MSANSMSKSENLTHPIYRIDKFIVPDIARAEFLISLQRTLGFLKTLPGYTQGMVLEQVEGNGKFNVVTFVSWESEAAVANARVATEAWFKQVGYDPRAMVSRLGVTADIGFYKHLIQP